MLFNFQDPRPNGFDLDIVWQVFRQLGVIMLAILKTILITAGRRTRLDLMLQRLGNVVS